MDTFIDFPLDPGCKSLPDQNEANAANNGCSDGIDNDGDGNIDFPADPGCATPQSPVENPLCNNGVDNDSNDLTDLPADPGCSSASDTTEFDLQCRDGLDNDGNGPIDFPDDPGCTSPNDNFEGPDCSDTIDNDCDSLADFGTDPGCASAADPNEFGASTTRQCSDGLDNDGDGFADYPADTGCASAWDDVEFMPNGAADLSITKTDGATTATPGLTTTYTITASNAGPSAANPASVTDTFPAACTSVSYTSVASGGATGNTAAGTGNINDLALNLPSGSSVAYTAICTIGAAATGSLDNTASIASAITDPVAGNNSSTDSDTILPPANVSGTLVVSGSFVTGGTITYTAELTNTGPGAQADNPGDEFEDVLPSSLALVSASASSGSATTSAVPNKLSSHPESADAKPAATTNNTVTWNGAIPSGASVTITITATILATGTVISNQGTIHFDGNGDGKNESTALTDDPTITGNNDATTFILVSPIPTLSGLGLLVLGVLLAGGVWYGRRRRDGLGTYS